jgi:hypothetical protein
MLLDLRGTSCTWDREKIPSSFFPAGDKRFFHPTKPLEALSLLSNSQGVLPCSDFGIVHIDHLTHVNRNRGGSARELFGTGISLAEDDPNKAALPACEWGFCSQNLSNPPSSPKSTPSSQSPLRSHPVDGLPRGSIEEPTELHTMHADVATESDACGVQYKDKVSYSQRTVDLCPSVTHPRKHMPQWGQELLMFYREPPPWSRTQPSPIVKSAPRPCSLEEPMSVDRTNKRATKGVQEMQEILSERRGDARTDGSLDSVKPSTKPSASRNPFAIPFGNSSAQIASEEASSLPRASVMVAPPKSVRSLKPISTLPVPIPPESSRRTTANNRRESTAAPRGPRRRQDAGRKSRQVSLPVKESCGLSGEGAELATARKRPMVSVSGSKKQDKSDSRSRGFDWSSWGASR